MYETDREKQSGNPEYTQVKKVQEKGKNERKKKGKWHNMISPTHCRNETRKW